MREKKYGLPKVENTPPCPLMKPPLPENHIRVVLDFIPVEERLPDCNVHVLFIEIENYWHRGNATPDGIWWSSTASKYIDPKAVTHWAEIPKIESGK